MRRSDDLLSKYLLAMPFDGPGQLPQRALDSDCWPIVIGHFGNPAILGPSRSLRSVALRPRFSVGMPLSDCPICIMQLFITRLALKNLDFGL